MPSLVRWPQVRACLEITLGRHVPNELELRQSESARGQAQSKSWRTFEPSSISRSVLDCACPLALWHCAQTRSLAGSEFEPLCDRSEPPHVGCYNFKYARRNCYSSFQESATTLCTGLWLARASS